MKLYYLLPILFFASCLISSAELTKDELNQLKDVRIAGARTGTWRNDARERLEELEINTSQNIDDPLVFDMTDFRMRLVVELTDRTRTKYIVRFTGSPSNNYDSEYQGEDYWKLRMAHGDLERLKISGFVIQYGFMDGETFMPLAEYEKRYEDILEGLRNRTTQIFPNRVYLWHYYMYNDQTEGIQESIPQNVRDIKE